MCPWHGKTHPPPSHLGWFACAASTQLLGPAAPNAAVRMYALLVLGRLGSRSSAVQVGPRVRKIVVQVY